MSDFKLGRMFFYKGLTPSQSSERTKQWHPVVILSHNSSTQIAHVLSCTTSKIQYKKDSSKFFKAMTNGKRSFINVAKIYEISTSHKNAMLAKECYFEFDTDSLIKLIESFYSYQCNTKSDIYFSKIQSYIKELLKMYEENIPLITELDNADLLLKQKEERDKEKEKRKKEKEKKKARRTSIRLLEEENIFEKGTNFLRLDFLQPNSLTSQNLNEEEKK
ncbi:MAG: hypothetical protein FWC79_01515 [Oscillospiraceae bacterium]|nr:hypothetical protein [Oscillospiraceae bacterium]